MADQGRNRVRVSFFWYQRYLDSEATRTTRTMKRGLINRRIVYWSCSLTQVAALRYSDTCGRRKSAWSHCRAISRWTSCSCPWTTDSEAKVEGWRPFCHSIDLFCSGFEVGVCYRLQESLSFVDYVLPFHRKSSAGIGRFRREYRGLPMLFPTEMGIQRDSQIVRECESPFSAEVNFTKLALLSSVGSGLSMA